MNQFEMQQRKNHLEYMKRKYNPLNPYDIPRPMCILQS